MSKRRHNFGTKRFKEKFLFIFHARIALLSLILLFVRLIARGARIGKTHTQTDPQTHRQNKSVTPAHARRELNIIYLSCIYTCKVKTKQTYYIYIYKVKSMDDNCGVGGMYGCGEQGVGVGVASGSSWNLWVWLLGVVVRRYIDFLILLIRTPLVSVLFLQQHTYFLFIFLKCFSFLFQYYFVIKFYVLNTFFPSINTHTGNCTNNSKVTRHTNMVSV